VERLTKRDIDVLTLVARGLSNDQIGEALFLSRQTVAGRISAMMRAVCVANRAELVARAFVSGLLTADEWPPQPTGRRCVDAHASSWSR
jgi:DNA-binding NarL/FixJ family response regulator